MRSCSTSRTKASTQGTYLDFWEQVWQWRDQGKAVVVVTHLLQNLDRVDTVLDLTPRMAEADAR